MMGMNRPVLTPKTLTLGRLWLNYRQLARPVSAGAPARKI